MSATLPVLRDWFAAHAADDREWARTLMAPDAAIHVADTRFRGFDAFMAWYDARRERETAFEYEVLDLLGGESHAAAVIALSDGESTWRQVAVYTIVDGRISALTLDEDEPDAELPLGPPDGRG